MASPWLNGRLDARTCEELIQGDAKRIHICCLADVAAQHGLRGHVGHRALAAAAAAAGTSAAAEAAARFMVVYISLQCM